MDIKEGNKIIGDFMGVTITTPYSINEEGSYHYDFGMCTHKLDYKSPDGKRHHTDYTVKFHSSWDWFIPVTIELLNVGFKLDISNFKIQKTPFDSLNYTTKESVWLTAIRLIQHINKLKELENGYY